MNYLILSGSTHGEKTRQASEALKAQLELQLNPDDELTYLNLQDLDMAFSDGRHPMDWRDDNAKVIAAILASEIIYIGSPIFQASIPGSLKNVFDLLPEHALERKTIGLVITAGSPRHYLVAEQQLMPILNYLKAVVVPKYVFIEGREFAGDGLASDDIQFRLQNLIQDTQQLAQAYQTVWQAEDESFGF